MEKIFESTCIGLLIFGVLAALWQRTLWERVLLLIAPSLQTKLFQLASESASERKKRLKAEKRAKDAEKRAKEAEERAEVAEERAEYAEECAEYAGESAADAEKRAEDAEKRAADAEKRAEDAEKRAADAEKRAADAEKRTEDAEERAEHAQKRAEEMLKQMAAVTNSHGALWQYSKDGSWETFPPEGNAQMQQAYLAYLKHATRSATITSGGVRRTVDFVLMQQEHVKTGNVRQVRLSLGVPEGWVTAPGDLLLPGPRPRSFYVPVEDPLFSLLVTRILRHTGHGQDGFVPGCGCMQKAKVKSIYRIEHLHLWQRYKTKLTALRQDHAKYNVQVRGVPLEVDNSGSFKILSFSQDSFACRDPRPVKCIAECNVYTCITKYSQYMTV